MTTAPMPVDPLDRTYYNDDRDLVTDPKYNYPMRWVVMKWVEDSDGNRVLVELVTSRANVLGALIREGHTIYGAATIMADRLAQEYAGVIPREIKVGGVTYAWRMCKAIGEGEKRHAVPLPKLEALRVKKEKKQ